jgi:Cof subfamily protein (haloacid dehalogenase superfamily)
MRYRLVATDIDGTLLNPDRKIAESTRRAIQELQRRGVMVVLVTARPPAMITAIQRDLGLTSPVIACNGAVIYDPVGLRALAHHPIPKEIALRVIAAIRRLDPMMNLGADLVDEWHIDRVDHQVHRRIAAGMVPVTGPLEQTIPAATKEVSHLYFRVMEARPAVEAALEQAGLARHLYIASAGDVVVMVAAGVNKGAALRTAAAMFNIPMEQTLALGDDENDIPLLRSAGLGVAMGNARDGLKAVAGAITRSNGEDGWAAAIEQHVFAS